MKKLLNEFKQFALKGNILDLAVAVVVGGAFSAIVKSFVDDIIMPLIGILMGGKGIQDWSVTVGTAVVKYGSFLQTILNFLIIAFALFIVVKVFNTAKERLSKKEAEEEVVEKVDETKLILSEIRDILKNR